jgi:hypothetical protein
MGLIKLRPDETQCWALAVGFGLLTGYVDFHNDEVQLPALLLLVFAFLLGFAQPKGVWRWALAVGSGVPLVHLIGNTMGYSAPYPTDSSILFLPVIVALAGAYSGALIRNLIA